MSKQIILAELSQEQLLAHATAQGEALAKAEALIKAHETTIAELVKENKEATTTVVAKNVVVIGKKSYTLRVPKGYVKTSAGLVLATAESISASKEIAAAALEAGYLKEVTNA